MVGSRSFIIQWEPPDVEYQNGIIIHYVVNITEEQTASSTVYTSASTSLSLTLLHPAYTYQCRVAAHTVALGPFSPIFTVMTEEERAFSILTIFLP